MEKGKQREEISVTFIPVGSQTYQLKGPEKHESFNAYRLHLKAVLFVLYSNQQRCLRYQYTSLRHVLYRPRRAM